MPYGRRNAVDTSRRIRCAMIAALMGSLTPAAAGAAGKIETGASPALRRACASGALTAYTCAQHGITVPSGSAVPSPAPAPAKPSPAAAPAASPLPSESASSPASSAAIQAPANAPITPRGRRSRARVEAGPAVRPFQDTKKRYDLEIPEGWTLQMKGGFAAFAHGDDWMQLRSTAAATAEAAAAAGVDLLRDQYMSFKTTADAPVQVGSRAGRRLTLSAASKAGRPSSLVVVAAPLAAGENLVIIAGGDPADAPAIEAGVSAVVRTVRFR